MDFKKKRKYAQIIFAVVGIVMFVAVALPVTAGVISTLNWSAISGGSTGTTGVVINLLPLFIAIGAMVYVISSVVA